MTPSPRPALISVTGTITSVGDAIVGIRQTGQDEPVGFMLGRESTVVRSGIAASGSDLNPGDSVQMIVDGRTGRILLLQAEATTATFPVPSGTTALLAAIGWLAGATILLFQSGVLRWTRLRQAVAARPLPRLIGTRAQLAPQSVTLRAHHLKA